MTQGRFTTNGASAPVPLPVVAVSPAPVSAQRKILVVDDEAGIRRGCQRVLTAAGHEVLVAERVDEALALVRKHPDLELALVDLRMAGGPESAPDMGGMELLSALQDQAPQVVTAVITAYATIESAIEATRRGAYDFPRQALHTGRPAYASPTSPSTARA